MHKKDYYEILGVDRNASSAEIKKQFKKLAKEYHPDKVKDSEKLSEYENKFKEINEANSVLSDKNKRALYDKFGHSMGMHQSQYGSDDINEIIRNAHESFFGRQQHNVIQPIIINVGVKLKEMYYGVTKKYKFKANVICGECSGIGYSEANGGSVDDCPVCKGTGVQNTIFGNAIFSRPCPNCSASGKVIKNGCKHCNSTGVVKEEKIVDVEIPKGAFSGMNMVYSGIGNQVIIDGNVVSGDLVVIVNEIGDDSFIRDGVNLHRVVEVPIIDCILGAEVTVESIDGKINKFKINTGTEAGAKFKLSGLGMPKINTNTFGDLHVHIKHIMPKSLSNKEIEVLNEFKNINKIKNG